MENFSQIINLIVRYLLLFLIVTVTSCSGQQATNTQSKIDTAKLFNPNGHPDNAGAIDMNMFKRSIAVSQHGFAMILDDKETDVETLSEVESLIVSNKEEIKKSLFYVLMDSTTEFKRTTSIISLLTKNQISNYKVINIHKYFTPPEPVTIHTPTSVETSYKLNDSTYFSMTILDRGIDAKLLGKVTKLNTIDDLDAFVAKHKSEIKNIVIVVTREIPNDKIKPVLEVLKKHEYYKYNLVTK